LSSTNIPVQDLLLNTLNAMQLLFSQSQNCSKRRCPKAHFHKHLYLQEYLSKRKHKKLGGKA